MWKIGWIPTLVIIHLSLHIKDASSSFFSIFLGTLLPQFLKYYKYISVIFFVLSSFWNHGKPLGSENETKELFIQIYACGSHKMLFEDVWANGHRRLSKPLLSIRVVEASRIKGRFLDWEDVHKKVQLEKRGLSHRHATFLSLEMFGSQKLPMTVVPFVPSIWFWEPWPSLRIIHKVTEF